VAQFNEFPISVAWSPDGTRIAVGTVVAVQMGFPTSMHIVSLASGDVVTAVENEGWISQPGWSSDSTRLLFTMGRILHRRPGADLPNATLWSYEVASGQLEQLVDLEQMADGVGFVGLGVWSP
jgi:Tol biopolymer transport system component